ncbi:DUF3857 domain-containing transglutaminase family protein [Lysobacter sp. TAB13]|uniref:DUF3857 domain-containing transglutaminase family protein n=1 Tax=Lysobacter sp. TAB13 TaxID=3233065 RepID=UPI003F98F0B0
MHTTTLRLFAVTALALASASALAQNAAPAKTAPAAKAAAKPEAAEEAPARVERQHISYTVQADGSYIEQRESALKVLQAPAIERAKHESISYSASIQTLEVTEAYTRKADGRRVDVPKSNFQVETNEGRAGGGPAFSDIATTSLVFPDVEVGDTVVVNYKLIGKQPMFDRQFSVLDNVSANSYQGDLKVRIDTPASLWSQNRTFGAMKRVRDETVGDRHIVEWTYQNLAPAKDTRRDYSVYKVEDFPGYAFSTFRSYGQIAAAYGERALPKAAPTPRVRKLADEIAAGKKDQREVAKALYEWVSTNIQYAGNCIGLGAVVPRDQEFVLDNRIGDCKDHATLLQALLAAKNVPATQALINAGNVYQLPDIPVASSVNHVLNYLPGLDLYVDATAKGIPFGDLPIAVAGKPVLRVDQPELKAATAPFSSKRNRQRMVTDLIVQEDGSVKGKVEVELEGQPAIETRAAFRKVREKDSQQMIKKYFEAGGLSAEGSFTQDDPQALLDKHRYSAQFEVKQMLPVPGAFPVGPLFFNPMPVATFASSAQYDDSVYESEGQCIGGRSEEIYRIEFPATMKVIAVPPDARQEWEGSSYEAKYTLKGNVLEARRVIVDASQGPVCTQAHNRGYQQFAKKVLPNLKAQLVYQ